jgi:pyruvate,orthophosphate dikinase
MILAASDGQRQAALAELLPLQRADFEEILAAMDGRPVTIRLLDPPLHEFLPSLTELTGTVARREALDEDPGPEGTLLEAVRHMHEENPMLGLRGVRLGLAVPGLYAMQVRAIAEATLARIRAGGDPRPEIMVPLVADAKEMEVARAEIEEVLASFDLPPIPIGSMIETPRAALTAGAVARFAEFFSFGTNDLTQMTWGFSRDDVEGTFLPGYLQRGILPGSPFESIDRAGVGALVITAVQQGRARRPDLGLGVCGEHGGDPASIAFFHEAGLGYVSCSPLRIPIARLAAGRAALGDRLATSADSR